MSTQIDLGPYVELRVANTRIMNGQVAGSQVWREPVTTFRYNLFTQPTPQIASGGAWGFQPGTGEAQTATLNTTAGAGPEGRTKFQRRTVTTAKTAGGSGIFYRQASPELAGNAGDVRSAGLWVRYSHVMTVTPQLLFRLGATTVGAANGTPVAAIPANTWRYITVTGTAPAAFDGLQAWGSSAASSVIPVGGSYDIGSVIAVAGATLGNYFDGDSPDTPTVTYSWLGTPWASVSEEFTVT